MTVLRRDDVQSRSASPRRHRLCRKPTRRHEQASTVLTSNKDFVDWEIFGDDVVADALIDRLVHHCHLVTIRGNNCRMRQHTELWQTLHANQEPEPSARRRAAGGPDELRLVPSSICQIFTRRRTAELWTEVELRRCVAQSAAGGHRVHGCRRRPAHRWTRPDDHACATRRDSPSLLITAKPPRGRSPGGGGPLDLFPFDVATTRSAPDRRISGSGCSADR
jgi:hypothetical protein